MSAHQSFADTESTTRERDAETESGDPEINLRKLAREVATEYPVPAEATQALYDRIRRDRVLVKTAAWIGCCQLIAGARTGVRNGISHDVLAGQERGMLRHAAGMRARASLFDWKMPCSGMSLGEAGAADLAEARDYHSSRAGAETARAEMYERIRLRLVKSRRATVREALTETTLRVIMTPAEAA